MDKPKTPITDKLKEYFQNTPDDVIREQWKSTEHFDDVESPLIEDNRVDITLLVDFIKQRIKANTHQTSSGKWTVPLNHINIDVAMIIRLLNIKIDE